MIGWIKLHRQLLEWEWYDDLNVRVTFIHLVLIANHKPKKYKGIEIGVGQTVTGLDILSVGVGISVQKLRTALEKLKATNDITIKTSSKGSIIQVVNYKKYQVLTSEVTNEQQTSNKPITTNKNEKNEKNENNKEIGIDFNGLKTHFNTTCNKLPSIKIITESRKSKLKALLKQYSKEDVIRVFIIANKSPFLIGENSKGWKANFDWLINITNFTKVLENTYESKSPSKMIFHE